MAAPTNTGPSAERNYQLEVVRRGVDACKKFKDMTGICLESRAMDKYCIHSWDFNIVDWWAYNGKCIPDVGKFWKTPHLLDNKQEHVLSMILFHPILEPLECRVFVNIFEQGDFDQWVECWRYHYAQPRGHRWWPQEKSKETESSGKGGKGKGRKPGV